MSNDTAMCAKPGCDRTGKLMFRYGEWWCDSHMPLYDAVEHPKHYNAGSIEVIDAIDAWDLGFCEGNVVKYVARAKHKGNELEDLQKALWYLTHRIEKMEGTK
jgi:hypothetical protein